MLDGSWLMAQGSRLMAHGSWPRGAGPALVPEGAPAEVPPCAQTQDRHTTEEQGYVCKISKKCTVMNSFFVTATAGHWKPRLWLSVLLYHPRCVR